MKYPLKTSLGIVHFEEELKSDKSRLLIRSPQTWNKKVVKSRSVHPSFELVKNLEQKVVKKATCSFQF